MFIQYESSNCIKEEQNHNYNIYQREGSQLNMTFFTKEDLRRKERDVLCTVTIRPSKSCDQTCQNREGFIKWTGLSNPIHLSLQDVFKIQRSVMFDF